jgi:hypothetical protein
MLSSTRQGGMLIEEAGPDRTDGAFRCWMIDERTGSPTCGIILAYSVAETALLARQVAEEMVRLALAAEGRAK